MKIMVIHGQSHTGSTCMVARELAEKVGGQTREFFLPRDFDRPCLGCWTCFRTDLTHCPHYERLRPIVAALDEADLIILASPVYVYHATGQMMALLDHLGTRWMVHRPDEKMCRKQAVALSTAAGGGMKTTCKDMADSLEFWGVGKVYRLGLGVRAAAPAGIEPKILSKIHRKTDRLARTIRKNAGRSGVTARGRFWFYMVRLMHKAAVDPDDPDYAYWERKGWHGRARPWK